MRGESIQKRLGRARNAPRVHITFDVQVGDATRQVELPFVLGVLADLSHNPEQPLKKLDQRDFVDLDSESFDKVLRGAKPRTKFQVENALQNDGSTINVDLKFESLADFDPLRVAERVPELSKLLATRRMLEDFMTIMEDNVQLEDKLNELLRNPDLVSQIQAEARQRALSTPQTDSKDSQP